MREDDLNRNQSCLLSALWRPWAIQSVHSHVVGQPSSVQIRVRRGDYSTLSKQQKSTACCLCAESVSGSPSLWLINTLTQDSRRLLSADQLAVGCHGTLCTAQPGTKTLSRTLDGAGLGTHALQARRRLAQAGSPATNCCQHSIAAPQVGQLRRLCRLILCETQRNELPLHDWELLECLATGSMLSAKFVGARAMQLLRWVRLQVNSGALRGHSFCPS